MRERNGCPPQGVVARFARTSKMVVSPALVLGFFSASSRFLPGATVFSSGGSTSWRLSACGETGCVREAGQGGGGRRAEGHKRGTIVSASCNTVHREASSLSSYEGGGGLLSSSTFLIAAALSSRDVRLAAGVSVTVLVPWRRRNRCIVSSSWIQCLEKR